MTDMKVPLYCRSGFDAAHPDHIKEMHRNNKCKNIYILYYILYFDCLTTLFKKWF